MPLTTLEKFKIHAGIADTDTTDDQWIIQAIPQVEQLILDHINRKIEKATYTEFYQGNGQKRLLLDQYPVQSVTTVHEDNNAYYGEASGAFASDTLLTAGEDYVLERDNNTDVEKSKIGAIIRIGTVWPRVRTKDRRRLTIQLHPGVGNIKVVYVAGYDANRIPASLTLAANQMLSQVRLMAARGAPMQSESLDYYSYNLVSPMDMEKTLGSVKQLLTHYRRWVI